MKLAWAAYHTESESEGEKSIQSDIRGGLDGALVALASRGILREKRGR